jgi:Zn-dependent protease
VSLAGPAANMLLGIVLGVVLQFAPVTATGIWPGLAFLAFLQVTAVVLNLIPLPPFDGFGAVEPYLPSGLRMRLAETRGALSWVVFFLLWYVPAISAGFWRLVASIAGLLNIPIRLALLGLDQFMFWR